jgi:hypothetical protein
LASAGYKLIEVFEPECTPTPDNLADFAIVA